MANGQTAIQLSQQTFVVNIYTRGIMMVVFLSMTSRRAAFAAAVLALLLANPGAPAHGQDHTEHGGSVETMSHDDHQMTPEMLAVLRERIPAYRDAPDQRILLEMQMMGPGQSRYLSADSVRGETAVLVLIHGFGETGDRVMTEAVQPMATIFPAAMSAGMSMMGSDHIQQSIDDLTAAGAKTIIVVPMASSRRNSLIYQWQYIFGLREHGAYYDVPRVQTDERVILADPPAGHPLITQIVLDHALEMSTDPENEVVFIIAHGPVYEKENQEQLAAMAVQARRIQELGGFSSVEGVTLQDDAAPEVRAGNVAALRKKIEAATAAGKRVLIVTDLLAARSIQWKIERDLEGLDYEFSVKGISMHPNFRRWFQETVMDAIKQ
jgi:sirohydrochlorin cobaltochelatase